MQYTISEFQNILPSLKNNLYKKIGEYDMYKKQLASSKDQKDKAEKNIELLKKTSIFLASVNKELRSRLISEVEKLVTMSIHKILNDDTLEFKLEFEITASNTNTRCRLYDKNTNEEYDIIDSFGGGLSDIISMALRLVAVELWSPKNELPIILDECGKFVSESFQTNFSLFLKEWCKQFDRQIILISHIKEAAIHADKVIKITKKGNKSEVVYE